MKPVKRSEPPRCIAIVTHYAPPKPQPVLTWRGKRLRLPRRPPITGGNASAIVAPLSRDVSQVFEQGVPHGR